MIDITATHLKSLHEAAIGLLSAGTAYPVYFKTRFGIHTFGMKFPIDILILDTNFTVVKMRESLKPNNIFVWSPRFFHVLELPAESIKKLSVVKGDAISLTLTPSSRRLK